MTATTTAQESGKWSDHCPYSDGMFLRGRETVPSMQLMAPHKENYGQKARILDLQRIASFASGTLLGNNYSAAYGHVRSCYLQFFSSLAVCGRENMLTKAHQRAARLQSSHRWTPSCSLSSCFFDAEGLCASLRSHRI